MGRQIGLVRAPRIGETLVVARLGRLDRSLIFLLHIMKDPEARGVTFRSLAEGFDMRRRPTDQNSLYCTDLVGHGADLFGAGLDIS